MMMAGRIAFHLGAAALALSVGGAASSQSTAGGGADACAAITASAFGGTSASGKWVAADAAAGLPAYCEVTGTISPVSGSRIDPYQCPPSDSNPSSRGEPAPPYPP